MLRDELAKLSLFHDVRPGALSALAARAMEVTYSAGAVLFLAGTNSRGWFVVIEGLVRVVQGSGSRQHVIHSEGPGGTLGEVPLVTGEPHPATGIAAEPTRCALFDRPSLEAAIAEHPELAFVITRRLAQRVSLLVARLNERSAKSVRARLIEFLLAHAARSKRGSFSIGMTQQELSEELGTVREVASRELRRLTREGLIESLSGGRYSIPDRDALWRAAVDS